MLRAMFMVCFTRHCNLSSQVSRDKIRNYFRRMIRSDKKRTFLSSLSLWVARYPDWPLAARPLNVSLLSNACFYVACCCVLLRHNHNMLRATPSSSRRRHQATLHEKFTQTLGSLNPHQHHQGCRFAVAVWLSEKFSVFLSFHLVIHNTPRNTL